MPQLIETLKGPFDVVIADFLTLRPLLWQGFTALVSTGV